MTYPIVWVPSPKYTPGHPAPLIAPVHHRMVGTLAGTDAEFSKPVGMGRAASTNFGVGLKAGKVEIHQYVRLGDQAWGNGNWDASGSWDDRYPTTLINSRTISIEHQDNGNLPVGEGRGIVPEAVIVASLWLDRLLLSGDLAAMKAAGIRFRSGTEAAIGRELKAIPIDANHIIDHHYIAGRQKPSCWRPWGDDRIGFPQARFLAALSGLPDSSTAEDTVNSYPTPKVPSEVSIAKGTWIYDTSALSPGAGNIQIDPSRWLPFLGQPTSTYGIVEYVNSLGSHSGKAYFVKATDLGSQRPVASPVPADTTPFTQADIDVAVAKVKAEAAFVLGTAKAVAAKAEKERIALAEAARIRSI